MSLVRRCAPRLCAAVLLACGAAPGTALARKAFVTNFGSNNVTVFDTATNAAGSPLISVGGTPLGVAVTPDGKTAYVANSGTGNVTPIDVATNTAASPIATGGNFPVGVAITPDGKTAWVTNANSNTVTRIDLATNTTVGSPIAVGATPTGVAITPDGKTAYVTNRDDSSVSVIDTATGTVVGSPIPAGPGAYFPAITPDGKTAYVADVQSNRVTPIDLATNTAGTAITTGTGPIVVAVTPDGRTAYAANSVSSSVTPIDIATNTAGAPITAGDRPSGLAVTPDGRTGYVGNQDSDNVTTFDVATSAFGTSFLTGGSEPNAESVAIVPDQAPVAQFDSTPAPAGSPTSFDASGSSDPDGTVASYRWDFGDGTTVTTADPKVDHTYASAGSYDAKLTVTDDEGCSTRFVFTGQTASCNGKPMAATTQSVEIAAAAGQGQPPGQFTPPILFSRVVLSHRNTRATRAGTLFTVSCDSNGPTCTGTLKLQPTRFPTRAQAAANPTAAHFDVAAGKVQKLRVRLPAITQAQLRERRRAVVRAVVTRSAAHTDFKELFSVFAR